MGIKRRREYSVDSIWKVYQNNTFRAGLWLWRLVVFCWEFFFKKKMNALYVTVSIPFLLVLAEFNNAHGLTTFGKSQNNNPPPPPPQPTGTNFTTNLSHHRTYRYIKLKYFHLRKTFLQIFLWKMQLLYFIISLSIAFSFVNGELVPRRRSKSFSCFIMLFVCRETMWKSHRLPRSPGH